MPTLISVTTTVTDHDQAQSLAAALLAERLAACVQVDGPLESHYLWRGETHVDPEYRLTIKTLADRWDAVRDHLTDTHPYDEPQILRTDITGASVAYAEWVAACVRSE